MVILALPKTLGHSPNARLVVTMIEGRFACAGSADQNQVTLMVEEVAGGQITDQSFVTISGFEVELVDLFGQR